MEKSRFTESQIVAILKTVEARPPLGQIMRRHGGCAATHYGLKSKYGSAGVSEPKTCLVRVLPTAVQSSGSPDSTRNAPCSKAIFQASRRIRHRLLILAKQS